MIKVDVKDAISPYEAPESDLEVLPKKPGRIIPASGGTRFLNYIIDYIGVMVLSLGVGVVLALLAMDQLMNEVPDFLFGLLVMSAYYLFFEGVFHRTPGKFLTGTNVVDESGAEPTFGQILGRSFSRFVPFEAFSFLGSDSRGWHDRWPGTYVIKIKPDYQ